MRIVLKLGGAVSTVAAGEALVLHDAGHEVCVVHGAGPQISADMRRRGIPVHFVDGRRVTTRAGLEVVRASFAAVNAAVCAAIGPKALPLFGDELALPARPVPALGFVGDALPARPPAIEHALGAGRIPVVAPLAAGPLNVNADDMAAKLAVGLAADRLLLATDVPGVLVNGTPVPRLAVDDAEQLLGDGTLEGGIVPKLLAAVAATRSGVRAEIGETVLTT